RGQRVDRVGRLLGGPGIEVTLLVVPARAPAQAAADVEVLAQDVPHHVLGGDALGGALVVRAAGRVDVVVAGVPAARRRVDPALQGEFLGVRAGRGHGDFPGEHEVFGAARPGHGVLAGLQGDGLAVAAVDLRVEAEVGGQPAALGRVNPAPAVTKG